MTPDNPELERFFEQLKADTKKVHRSNLANTLVMAAIGGGLAYWAYGTVAHTVLFAFVVFSIFAVANRVTDDMRVNRAKDEARRLYDERVARQQI